MATPQIEQQRRRLTVGRGEATTGTGSSSSLNFDNFIPEHMRKDVTCICTATDQLRQRKTAFGDKDLKYWNGEASQTDANLEDLLREEKMFFVCRKGMKPESPNQDSFIILRQAGKWNLFGVFDGHGPNGHDASDMATKALVQTFLESDFIANTEASFTLAFTACQDELEKPPNAKNFSTSGSTCTMAFHNLETDSLTIAHAGDSRAVIYDHKKGVVIHATEDHKPNLPEEKKRIEANGGRVVFDGYYNYRVFAKTGMYPGLNMSRALGDIVAHKEAGLTASPECITISLREHRGGDSGELLMLLCSDGVWEFIESKDAATNFKGAKPLKDVAFHTQARALAQSSWDKWMEDSDNEISDDITVVAVAL